HVCGLSFAKAPARAVQPGVPGGVIGGLIKPATHEFSIGERACLVHQHQKGGLKGVFGVVDASQDLSTDSEHYGTMSPDNCLEGTGVLMFEIARQQIAIGDLGAMGDERNAFEVTDDVIQLCRRHKPISPRNWLGSLLIIAPLMPP